MGFNVKVYNSDSLIDGTLIPFEIELFESATPVRALSSTVRVGMPDTDTNVCTGNSATLANQIYDASQIVICRARDSVTVQNVEVRSGAVLEIFSKSIGLTDFIAKLGSSFRVVVE